MVPSETAHETVGDLLRHGRARLGQSGLTGPDAELLLAHVLGISRGRLQVLEAIASPVAAADATRFADAVTRRAAREPLQHITGRAPFRHIELEVGPGAFVPRPETELLVELALERLPEGGTVLDAGTGSGAIAVAIAVERPDARVSAVEASPAAFVWARRNVRRLAPGVELIHDRFERTLARAHGIDLLVSNPPYVPHAAIPRDVEVFLHDPDQALYSGADGLDAIRALAAAGVHAVRPGGGILLEHAEHQGAGVREILADAGWRSPRTHRDLTGRDRVTEAVTRS